MFYRLAIQYGSVNGNHGVCRLLSFLKFLEENVPCSWYCWQNLFPCGCPCFLSCYQLRPPPASSRNLYSLAHSLFFQASKHGSRSSPFCLASLWPRRKQLLLLNTLGFESPKQSHYHKALNLSHICKVLFACNLPHSQVMDMGALLFHHRF
jgi:hypothetical protein